MTEPTDTNPPPVARDIRIVRSLSIAGAIPGSTRQVWARNAYQVLSIRSLRKSAACHGVVTRLP